MKGIITIPTYTREEWLDERRKSVGGSDASAIIGLNRFSSPYEVWAEKTGRIPPKDETEAMRQGRELEEYVAGRWSEATEKRCRRKSSILRNPALPFAHADIDRWVVGENAGVECKTTSSLNIKSFKTGDYPPNYYIQCVHYMAVTGADRWYLAVLVLGKEFYTFTVERDEKEITALMDAEREFWKHVMDDNPPPADGAPATSDTLAAIFKGESEGEIDLFGRESLIKEWHSLTERISALKTEKEKIKQVFMKELGNCESGHCGDTKVTWKTAKKATFDAAAFKRVRPDIDLGPFYRISQYRTFKISGGIDDE